MAGYEDTRQKIISTLMGRPNGTEIQPENHQDYALNMLDYIRGLELIASSTLIGIAEQNTTPVQPNSSRVCYIAGVAQNQTVVFENFIDENGNPISVTTGDMEGVFIILLWNTQYWSSQTFSTNIISHSESATFYYRYNIRKTYASIALMNADVTSPIGTDGKYIKIGDIVTVVNSTTPSENGIYSYKGADIGWEYQGSFNFQLSQTMGNDPNVGVSQKTITNSIVDLKKLKGVLYSNYLGNRWGLEDSINTDNAFYSYPDYKIKQTLVMPNIAIRVNDNSNNVLFPVSIKIAKITENGGNYSVEVIDNLVVNCYSLGTGFLFIKGSSLVSKPEYSGCNIFISVSGGIQYNNEETNFDCWSITYGTSVFSIVKREIKIALFDENNGLNSSVVFRSTSLNLENSIKELKDFDSYLILNDKLKNSNFWKADASYPLNDFSVNDSGEMTLVFSSGQHQAINNSPLFNNVVGQKICKLTMYIKRNTNFGGTLDIGCTFGSSLGEGYIFDGNKGIQTYYKTINPTSIYEKYEIYYVYLNSYPIISIGSHNSRNNGDTFVIKDISFSVIESELKRNVLDNSKKIVKNFIDNQVTKTNLLDIIETEQRKIQFVGTYSGYWSGNVGEQPVLNNTQEGFVSMDAIDCTDDELLSFVNFHSASTVILAAALDSSGNVLKILLGSDNIISTNKNRDYITVKLPIGTSKVAVTYDNRTPFGSYVNNDAYLLFSKNKIKNNIEIPVSWLSNSFIWNNTGGSDPTQQPGMIGSSPGYSASDFINYESGMVISINVAGSATSAITYYDVDKNYLGALPIGNYFELKINPPSGTVYIRLSINTANITTFKLTKPINNQDFVTHEELSAELNNLGHPITPIDGDLQTFINSNRSLTLGAGVWEISNPLTIPSNTKIVGIRGATIFRLIAGNSIINLSNLQSDIDINGIIFEGLSPITPQSTNVSNLQNRVGEGTKCGIYATGYIKNTFISGCEFRNFDLAGIRLYRTHSQYVRTFKITNNVFLNNFYGLLSDVRSEYHTVIGCTFSYNQIGCFIAGGNNFMGTCHFDANAVGCVISGTAGDNDSHGSITGSSFNHNYTFSIACIDINNGFTFSSCHCFQGDLILFNSKGFLFTGGIIAAGIVLQNVNTSINLILSNLFIKSYNGGSITGDASKLSLSGNRFIDGSDSSSINNSI